MLPVNFEARGTTGGRGCLCPTSHYNSKNLWRFDGIFGPGFQCRAPICAVRGIFDAIDQLV